MHAMDRHNKELASDILISGFIVLLAVSEGANPTFAVGALTVINTVSVAQIIQAFREIQAENREEYINE